MATMVTKPTKEFTDAEGRRKIKGNMDIELAIDVMEMAPHLDHIVIFSEMVISVVWLKLSSARVCGSRLYLQSPASHR